MDTAKAVEAMSTFGGSFIRALAQAWYCADSINRARLEQAFAPEFLRYLAMTEFLGSAA